LVGFQRDFTILDREDAKTMISTAMAEAEIDTKSTRFPKSEVLAEILSRAANTQETIPDLLEQQYEHFAALSAEIGKIQQRYTARKRASNSMDFDDLLILWLRLLREHAEVRE